MLKIAQIVNHASLTPDNGGRIKSASVASALAELGELHILSYSDSHTGGAQVPEPGPVALPFGGQAVWHDLREASGRDRFPRNVLMPLFHRRRLPFPWRPRTPRQELIWRRLEELLPDVVVADCSAYAAYAAFSGASLRVAATHNLESALWKSLADTFPERRAYRRNARDYARIEAELLNRVDQVWAVSPEDLAAYQSKGIPSSRLVLVPNVMPLQAFRPDPGPGEPGLGLFFSDLLYPPNRDAALELAHMAETFHREGRGFRLALTGRGAPPELEDRLRATPGLDFQGFVPDLDALLDRAAAVIVPLSQGGGTKLKVIQAMAAGRPVLTTPVGAEGLELRDGEHAVIRDLGPAFLDAARDMLSGPSSFIPMALRGQAHVRERFTFPNLAGRIRQAILKQA
jgi:glycosyltransferase involved in cell wall biosynthesis